MSEYNGDLRVATTTEGFDFGEQSESAVTVLRPNGEDLETISSVGGLGKTEQIRSVRFIDDTAYVVTFRQTDPLYVIDLSDPANPVLDGELKIPGYSAYLHPVGDGLLLGVGQDATEEGRTLGTQLSLFDVSDPTNPQQIDTLPIGGSSEVEWDHKAFLYWPEDGTIVLPVSPGWNSCAPDQPCLADTITGSAGGVIVAQLVDRDLSTRGVITHETDDQSGCWNPLQRSMVIGSETRHDRPRPDEVLRPGHASSPATASRGATPKTSAAPGSTDSRPDRTRERRRATCSVRTRWWGYGWPWAVPPAVARSWAASKSVTGYLTMRYEKPDGDWVIAIVRLPFASCSVNIGCSGAPQPTRIDPSGWTRTLPSVPPL